ncbi:protein-disulfide reductase DsbD [Thalassotalea sp. PS06]|uniref:protein-disulfide reductase DsbD family protein n=1 Tax=Thalassotalea sp. PS06 TaxID=2594005 RepID=UPI0021B0F2D7|nr:protein-disulfide reductase DsbD domain-containing protein [Thalassotalea sp. PS06]
MNLASANTSATGPHIEVSIHSENQSWQPGSEQWIGILLEPEDEWHTYWQNPGDSGEAPTINWSSDAELQFGHIQWPIPKAIPVAHLVNYGYEGANLLMVPVQVPENLNQDNITIDASLSWLVCKEDCIPGWADLSLTLPVQQQSQPSTSKPLFDDQRQSLPQSQALEGKYEITEEHISIAFTAPVASNWTVFPIRSDVIQHNQIQQAIADGTQFTSVIPLSDYFVKSDDALQFLVSDGETGYYLTTQANSMVPATIETSETSSLWLLVVMAFVGGLILNIMPCVLPVLSFKALSLSEQTMSLSKKLGYLIGVLFSFNVFAVLIIALKESGNAVGWGFHMQEPAVIVALCFLFVYITLTLLDIGPTGAKFAGVGQSLIKGDSFISQFFTGVLAAIVASPCTAPFMAAALGVALLSDNISAFVIFNALAIGFALPMTLLIVSKTFRNRLPKPGPWMNTFKVFLAFPMLATVVWLVWVFLGQSNGSAQFVLMMALLLFALLLWIASVSRGWWQNVMQVSALGFVVFATYISASVTPNDNATDNTASFEQAYSPAALAELKQNNQVVLVNMTADWCITCKVNEQVAFADQQVQSVLQSSTVNYMVGDWTNKNTEILEFLQQYQRSGVPLYVIYAGDSYEQVLPQILTADIVIEAINQAKKEINHG